MEEEIIRIEVEALAFDRTIVQCIPMGRRRNRPSQRQDHERERSEPIALPCCPTRARLTGPPTTGPPSCRDPHGTQSTLAREQQGAGVVWM